MAVRVLLLGVCFCVGCVDRLYTLALSRNLLLNRQAPEEKHLLKCLGVCSGNDIPTPHVALNIFSMHSKYIRVTSRE